MSPSPGRQLLDLHNHSDRSHDASNTLADYERAYAAGRFDAVAITDHNRIDGALAFAAAASFPVIVGIEVDTADGELIGLFLDEPIPAGLTARKTAELIRGQGGLVYLQHPFYRLVRKPLTGRAREQLAERGLVDVVEGRNGGPFTGGPDTRARAWARERGLPLGAGSDAHEPPEIGHCLVSVAEGPLDATTVLARLRDGTIVDRHRNSLAQVGTKARSRLAELPRRLVDGRRGAR
ncbi:MAG: PHP domain-containing protein [Thermoleophilia bacterium]|nr:PHP domain-containing protein [Thermoleophilia bacterium]